MKEPFDIVDYASGEFLAAIDAHCSPELAALIRLGGGRDLRVVWQKCLVRLQAMVHVAIMSGDRDVLESFDLEPCKLGVFINGGRYLGFDVDCDEPEWSNFMTPFRP